MKRESAISAAIDFGSIAAISLAICSAATNVDFMSLLVPSTILIRFWAWWKLGPQTRQRGRFRDEIIFFAICISIGAFNDWNTVHMHSVYAYLVPTYYPELSCVPLWMLLYWGLILRSLSTLFHQPFLGHGTIPDNTLRLPWRELQASPGRKVAIQLLLVAITRPFVYLFHDHLVLSWLPLLAALALYIYLFPLDPRRWTILVLLTTAGPAIEIAYIQLGGLHRYALGWFGGVPAWIVVWWGLAGLIWDDLGPRLQRKLAPERARRSTSSDPDRRLPPE
ncbi:MAG: hypothetical protein V3V08_11950 [Nannocystaceae bacterium]